MAGLWAFRIYDRQKFRRITRGARQRSASNPSRLFSKRTASRSRPWPRYDTNLGPDGPGHRDEGSAMVREKCERRHPGGLQGERGLDLRPGRERSFIRRDNVRRDASRPSDSARKRSVSFSPATLSLISLSRSRGDSDGDSRRHGSRLEGFRAPDSATGFLLCGPLLEQAGAGRDVDVFQQPDQPGPAASERRRDFATTNKMG